MLLVLKHQRILLPTAMSTGSGGSVMLDLQTHSSKGLLTLLKDISQMYKTKVSMRVILGQSSDLVLNACKLFECSTQSYSKQV